MKKKERAALSAEACDEAVERLLQEPYHVIDFLPAQVPADSVGQYFAVEAFYREPPRRKQLYRKFADLLLGLNCYCGLTVTDGKEWRTDVSPAELYAMVENCPENGFLNVLTGSEDSLITLYGGDLYMTLYRASDKLLELTEKLACVQGLFVRKGQNL